MLVSAVQFASTLDKEANRRRAVAAVRSAADAGAGLVVLPEAAMCSFGEPTTDLGPLAEPLDGPFVTAISQAASAAGATVLAGTFEPAGRPGVVHNTVVAVGPGGLVGTYRKLHLYDALGWCESDRVVAGDPADPLLVFGLGDLVVGVMTCYDLRFPEMARSLVDRGATVLAIPALWVAGPGKKETWEVLVRARAIESTAYVVAAGQPGPTGTGVSTVVDPSGTVLASAPVVGDERVTAEVASGRVAEVRATMPVLAHRRFSVVPRV